SWWEWLYLEGQGVGPDFFLVSLTHLRERIAKEWVGKWIIQIEQVERRAGTGSRRSSRSRNYDLCLGLNRPELEFSCAGRGDCGLICDYIVRSAIDGFYILSGLL